MLIPNIKFIGYLNSVVVVPSINNYSFKENSFLSTGKTIVTRTWSYTILSGSVIAVLGGSLTDEEFTIGLDATLAVTARIELSVTDSDGRIAKTSMLVIDDGGGNINIIDLKLDSFVLPTGIVVFTPVETQTTAAGVALYGSSPFFSTYDIDYTNNAVFDDSNPTGANFENQYATTGNINALLSMTDLINGFILNDLYTEVSFEAVIENPLDIIITTNSTCTLLEVSSQSTNLVELLVGRAGLDNSDMEYLSLKLDQNCCNAILDIKLAPQYNFSFSIVPLTTTISIPPPITIGGFDYLIYEFSLELGGLNLDPSLITSVEYTAGGNSSPVLSTLTTITNPIVLPQIQTMVPAILPDPVSPEIVENNKVIITTSNGYIYTIDYTITPSYLAIATFTIVVTTTIYPIFPTGITVVENVNNTVIQIDPSVFSSTVFVDGIYQVTLNNSGISNTAITGCTFVDCETYCLIIKALANGCNPIIQILYDALVQFNLCTNIPCTNVCDLFVYLESLLNECDCSIFQNNIISKNNRCGCNS